MSTEINHDNLTEKERKSMARRAGLASLVGTTIEWYDFFLFGTMAALVFPDLFFGGDDPYLGLPFSGTLEIGSDVRLR
ncbi:hypothetical protein ACFSCZ_19210 [Siminovitchia sediminis]|uniref:MFS transporter n=1 Tax=Siminovitchia sediminis TaxID=1274353 RepID=A0ABW4KRA1_9BACI